MADPTISIIIPVYHGPRWRLPGVFSDLREQLSQDDQVVVIGDGPVPEAEELVKQQDERFIYQEGPKTRMVGNAQRDLGMTLATKEWLMFVDEENIVPGKALDYVRESVALAPDRPHTFPLLQLPSKAIQGREGRDKRECGKGAIGGSQFVPPNVKRKLGSWSKPIDNRGIHDGGDVQFINQTMEHYPQGAMFHDKIICHWIRN